ncbi:MAG: VCBS repeat-containing protein [Sedimentisphaerales bacterium]|nr:VCBS repeat-containing protein [Sedimentisphaerales bacterium]
MKNRSTMGIFICCFLLAASCSSYGLTWSEFGPVELIEAGDPSEIIAVEAYSVPSLADWNNDGLADLIVGEGPTFLGKGLVRLYLNTGTAAEAAFTDGFSYIQSGGSRLEVPGEGCLGTFPRVVQWDGDGKKDLLIGLSDGTIRLYLNTGTDAAPVFSGWQSIEVGAAGNKVPIDVGSRACSIVTDWNSDGKKDLVVGSIDGTITVFINTGTDTSPDFLTGVYVEEDGLTLLVPGVRSSPAVGDLNNDGKKDLLVGNTEGNLLVYLNVGTDENPTFSGFTYVESDGEIIDLPHDIPAFWARSRPFLCDWTGDGYWDVLVGTNSYGKAYLYEGLVFLGDFEPDGDVDFDDLLVLANQFLQTPEDPIVDIAPYPSGDNFIDLQDFAVFSQNWLYIGSP